MAKKTAVPMRTTETSKNCFGLRSELLIETLSKYIADRRVKADFLLG